MSDLDICAVVLDTDGLSGEYPLEQSRVYIANVCRFRRDNFC